MWVSHISKWHTPVDPKVSEVVANNQLLLKKKYKTLTGLQRFATWAELGSSTSASMAACFLASAGNEKQESEVPGLGRHTSSGLWEASFC